MKLPGNHASVLIVGAGPSGLMMAAQLLRNGVQPVIIDSKKGPADQSKAIAVQARSLEIYRQMGIIDRIILDGKKAPGVTITQNGEQLAQLSLHNVGEQQTLFPYILTYEQSKNERLLLDYLTQNCCPVYWDTTLVSFLEQANNVDALLKNDNHETYLTCDWIIAADGAHSTVRKQLGIPFKGDTYQNEFYLADVSLEDKTDDNLSVFLTQGGFAAFFPLAGQHRYRIIGSLTPELVAKANLNIDDVKPYLASIVKTNINISQTYWFTTYLLHHRMAESFRSERTFLIGDAAHIHSPIGGQGMNTGLQDAYNLAWKLAGVINKQHSPAILNSYADERMPVARQLLKTTDRAFSFILSNNYWNSIAKKWLLPIMLKKVWNSENARQLILSKVSQLGINYHESKINMHLSPASKILAGDRLPYLKVYDEKKQVETDLHEWCSKPGFTFIAMGKLSEDELFKLARWITKSYPANLNFFYLPPTNKNRHVFNAFEITASQQKTLIVRPDMYLGFINDSVDIAKINNYLTNNMMCLKQTNTEQ